MLEPVFALPYMGDGRKMFLPSQNGFAERLSYLFSLAED